MKARNVILGMWAALVFAILVGCTGGSPVTPSEKVSVAEGSDIVVPGIVWRIRSQSELKAEYAAAKGGQQLEPLDSLQGFSALGPDGTVYVYTLPPKNVDDEVTLTLGHEVMHTVLGAYHPPYRGH